MHELKLNTTRTSKRRKIQQNKTTLVQSPLTALGQETRDNYNMYEKVNVKRSIYTRIDSFKNSTCTMHAFRRKVAGSPYRTPDFISWPVYTIENER